MGVFVVLRLVEMAAGGAILEPVDAGTGTRGHISWRCNSTRNSLAISPPNNRTTRATRFDKQEKHACRLSWNMLF
jgi:hypothetical protein